MTPEIAILLAIIAAAMVLFSFEWAPPDVVALGILLALILAGLLPAEKAFAGFGSDTVLMILGLFILTSALLRTGFVDIAGREILKRTGTHPDHVLLVIMIAAAGLSAFISNTAATAFFLPVTFGIAERAKQSPSRFLMPLAFASILTSSVTLVSTSTNLVVSNLMARTGMEPLGMFELAPVGIPIAVAGIAYMYLIGRRWIPERAAAGGVSEQFGLHPYLTEVLILPDSPLVGKTLDESGLGRDLDLTVLRIVREKSQYLSPFADTKLQAGDVLLVEGLREHILKVKDTAGIDIKADAKLASPDLEADEMSLVEGILLPRSPLIGRTLKGVRFRERHGLQVLAINRAGGIIHRKISQIPLRMGDVLLVQGRRENIKALEGADTFRILGAVGDERPNVKRAWTALAIFVFSLVAASTGLLALPVAVLLGSLLVFITRCITPEEAYREVEWKALILIGCMLGLGTAMEATGTEKYLAGHIVSFIGSARPIAILSGFFLLTVALTQPMSNQAAAVVVVPVAIQTAVSLRLDPRPFAVMVAVAASCSYLTPLEPSCLMVYGPGRYKFSDFVKVGGALTLVIYAIAIVLVPLIWKP